MPVLNTDLKFRLSGGAGNSNPNASLGGAMSGTEAPLGQFDDVSSGEATAGDTEYRCIYVLNSSATHVALSAVVWMLTNTTGSRINIGLGTAAVSAQEQTVANESTAPSGVTFSAAATEGAGLVVGDLPAGGYKAVWLRRVIPSAAGLSSDTYTLRAKCDTLP